MSTATNLRFVGLLDNVRLVQNSISANFPGAGALKSLTEHYLNMATSLFPLFLHALNTVVTDEEEKQRAEHKMIDKLAREWENIFQLLATAKLLSSDLKTTDEFSWLDVLTKTAQKDLNISGWDFIVIPKLTQQFALTQFKYAPMLASLDIPITTLNAPWEWSIIWHELAGRKIKEIKKQKKGAFNIPSIQAFQRSQPKKASELLDQATDKLQAGKEIGIRLLKQIRKAIKIPEKPNWSDEWVEELFEDACSVLTFGVDFLPVFKSILGRNSASADKRHPDPVIRERIASRLLAKEVSADAEVQEKIEKAVLKRIQGLVQEFGLSLAVSSPNASTEVHRELVNIMKKFNDPSLSSADIDMIKDRLSEQLGKSPEYKRSRYKDPMVDVAFWEEVASKDYKRMLGIKLSEKDAFEALTHTSTDHNNARNILNLTGRIDAFYSDGEGVRHNHDHGH